MQLGRKRAPASRLRPPARRSPAGLSGPPKTATAAAASCATRCRALWRPPRSATGRSTPRSLTPRRRHWFRANASGRYPPGDSRARYGRNMRPLDFNPTGNSSPVFSYPYEEYRSTLEKMREKDEWDPCHGLKMTFINPLSGGPVMPTIAAFVQLLPKDFSGAGYQSTDGTIYSVVDGTGYVEIDDLKVKLSPKDVFVVPSWSVMKLTAEEDMVLFSFSDRSAQEKLGIWKEQREISGVK